MSYPNYPKHDHSKFIDQDFSFNNQIKSNTIGSQEINFIGSDGIMLEPRLQEYIKRKKFDRENSIRPCVSAETEFLISQKDIKDIRTFFKNGSVASLNDSSDWDTDMSRKSFPSTSLKLRDDSRVQKPKDKTNKINTPINRGMFAPDSNSQNYYEDAPVDSNFILDARDFSSGAGSNNYKSNFNSSRFNPRSDRQMYQGDTKSDITSLQDRYKLDTNTSRDNSCDYNMLSTIGNGPDTDVTYDEVDTDTYLTRGLPQHPTKSFGLRNPAEHYFQYIDPSFQNATNTVESYPRGGVATRLNNKETARPKYRRDIM